MMCNYYNTESLKMHEHFNQQKSADETQYHHRRNLSIRDDRDIELSIGSYKEMKK